MASVNKMAFILTWVGDGGSQNWFVQRLATLFSHVCLGCMQARRVWVPLFSCGSGVSLGEGRHCSLWSRHLKPFLFAFLLESGVLNKTADQMVPEPWPLWGQMKLPSLCLSIFTGLQPSLTQWSPSICLSEQDCKELTLLLFRKVICEEY